MQTSHSLRNIHEILNKKNHKTANHSISYTDPRSILSLDHNPQVCFFSLKKISEFQSHTSGQPLAASMWWKWKSDPRQNLSYTYIFLNAPAVLHIQLKIGKFRYDTSCICYDMSICIHHSSLDIRSLTVRYSRNLLCFTEFSVTH